jgi:hypothetical protein
MSAPSFRRTSINSQKDADMAQAARPAPMAERDKPAIPPDRKLPVIDPAFVVLNADSFAYRQFMVRLPEGAIADDLKEPLLWSRVQANRNVAMRKHDHLYIVAFDESWAADAVVVQANAEMAVISRPRLMRFAERLKPFYSDGIYAVAWYGNGYAVKRLADGTRMTQIVANEALAERDLGRLYPRPL